MPSIITGSIVRFAMISVMLVSCGRPLSISSLADNATQRFWPVSFPSDAQLSQSHKLMPYMKAATAKELPLRFFRELIQSNSSVTVIEGSWPSYKPGYLYGGTIYMPSASNPEAWTRGEWSSFYNELFHAWYGLVFLKSENYEATRSQVQTAERMNHYRRAYPADPALAQEEAWSETVAALLIELAPVKIDDRLKYPEIERMKYAIGRTVSAVSHSDRPGYTPEAEETYPAEWEYAILFRLLTMVQLP